MYAVDNYLILARWMKVKFALCLFEDQVGGGGQGNSEARGGETSGMWRATVGGLSLLQHTILTIAVTAVKNILFSRREEGVCYEINATSTR